MCRTSTWLYARCSHAHANANIIVSGIIISGILIDNKRDSNIISGIIKISGIIISRIGEERAGDQRAGAEHSHRKLIPDDVNEAVYDVCRQHHLFWSCVRRRVEPSHGRVTVLVMDWAVALRWTRCVAVMPPCEATAS